MQCPSSIISAMERDPNVEDLDDAIDTAVRRTSEAELSVVAEPIDSPDLLPKVEVVVHRAEDLHELATDGLAAIEDDETTS